MKNYLVIKDYFASLPALGESRPEVDTLSEYLYTFARVSPVEFIKTIDDLISTGRTEKEIAQICEAWGVLYGPADDLTWTRFLTKLRAAAEQVRDSRQHP